MSQILHQFHVVLPQLHMSCMLSFCLKQSLFFETVSCIYTFFLYVWNWYFWKLPEFLTTLVEIVFSIYVINSGFGGLVVSMLASSTQDRRFDPGRSRRIFRAKKSTACLPWGGSKAVSHVADLRSMSKYPGFTWKSKSQAKLTGHFSPIIPSFADRGLSCRLHVEAPRGKSGNV